jgi:hypothetical protein
LLKAKILKLIRKLEGKKRAKNFKINGKYRPLPAFALVLGDSWILSPMFKARGWEISSEIFNHKKGLNW